MNNYGDGSIELAPDNEFLVKPELSYTKHVYHQFLEQEHVKDTGWIREVVALILETNQKKRADRIARATSLYKKITQSHNQKSGLTHLLSLINRDQDKVLNDLNLDRRTTRAVENIGHKSASRLEQQQINSLKNGNSPESIRPFIDELIERAWELRSANGTKDGRTESLNRAFLAALIQYLAKSGHTKIGLVAADMNGLKAYNKKSTRLGDCGLLTIFHASDIISEKHGTILAIPSEQGGDDVVLIKLYPPQDFAQEENTGNEVDQHRLAELEDIPREINELIAAQIPDIRAYQQEKIFDNKPLRFDSTMEEKNLSEDEVKAIETAAGNYRIKPPTVTGIGKIVNLDPSNPVNHFFQILKDTHLEISRKKEQEGQERGELDAFLGDPIPT